LHSKYLIISGLKTVFMIGRSLNETVNELIVEEAENFGDIVQEDFMDTYRNLTIKTVRSLVLRLFVLIFLILSENLKLLFVK